MPVSKQGLVEEIGGRLVRQHSTAVTLFHHALAEHLGLGPTDHKCFDLLRERGTMTGSELAAVTGLTTGAITGVVARLERAGYVRREADQTDGRKQTLYATPNHSARIGEALKPIRGDVSALLERFDSGELTAIAQFITEMTTLVYDHAAILRAKTMNVVEATPPSRRSNVRKSPQRRKRK